MWDSDGVQVEVIVLLADKEVDDLPRGGQSVADRRRLGIALGPDDLVANDPAVGLKGKSQALGAQQEALGRGAVAVVAGVGVSEVEPE
jgi:hypothetical protein